jgi:hypothetical protein
MPQRRQRRLVEVAGTVGWAMPASSRSWTRTPMRRRMLRLDADIDVLAQDLGLILD